MTETERPAFILLNSGILHRVGSCRLHVKLARALAAGGFTSLRFDFSGIGDSEQRRDSLSFEESSVVEVREAMDYLAQSRGVNNFVLMGLCSGADMGHLTAVQDNRVRGLVLIDPWAYRTPGYWFHHYGRRVFKAGVWKNWAAIRMRRMLGELSARRGPSQSNDQVSYEVPKYVRVFPPREQVSQQLADFVRRGMDIFAIFTSGMPDEYNHRSQYRRSFRDVDFGNRLRVEFMPTADHIITDLALQAWLVGEVVSWGSHLVTTPATPQPRHPTPPTQNEAETYG
jgi:pimeloyl-ACP methyl ester carboxylesterase